MKIVQPYASLINLLMLLMFTSCVHAQNLDVEKIASVRKASNEALAAFDTELDLSYMTEDAHNTTGNSTLINGKEELRNYIRNIEGEKLYWVRTHDEIVVNPTRGLAWESGTWKGYRAGSNNAVMSGKYAAQWTNASGQWLIKSQLFVTLEN